MDQPRITPLTPSQREGLRQGLALAARMAGVPENPDTAQVQVLYDVFLGDEIADYELVLALGLAFGRLVVAEGHTWVRVHDAFGDETAVAARGGGAVCHPISIIQKRLSDGVKVDVAKLRDEMVAVLRTGASA